MVRYGMVIDLNKCVRSRTCYIVCKREHKIPAHPKDKVHLYEYYRLRYLSWEWGKYPRVKRTHIPIFCMHCDDPICIRFCSIDAITQREDGIIIIDKDSCTGCGVCVYVCPYGALYINADGKADGCDFCVDRVELGLPPKCVEECPARAIIFGDLNDPESKISKLISSSKAKPLIIGEATNPSIYYIPSQNESEWKKISENKKFQEALSKRKRDLPPLKGLI